MMTEETDRLASARSQGRAQYDSIVEMVEALRAARDSDDWDAVEQAQEAISNDALDIQMRSGWASAGEWLHRDVEPAEYTVLLCTGGPACRIIGEMDGDSPTTARIQVQDWFTPWTDIELPAGAETFLLEYVETLGLHWS